MKAVADSSSTASVVTAMRLNRPLSPLVLLMVSGKLPEGVRLLVATVRVVVPPQSTTGGSKLVAVPGNPLTLKLT